MRLFKLLRKKPEELVVTREVLIEKWEEGGPEVIQSLTHLIRNKVAPLLAEEMTKAGFEMVILRGCGRDNRDEEWEKGDLLHKKLCSSLPVNQYYAYNRGITNFETYSKWALRAEKMVEKISEIKREVAEMKLRRNALADSIKSLTK